MNIQLERFPRLRLGHLPTPLEPMERLSEHLGGPAILIKRDDCTGLATGGNKTRKLEFLLGEALQQGADTLITLGAVQSNHVRQTAAAAARAGLDCVVLLERRVPGQGDNYEQTGNVFLDRLLGAEIEFRAAGLDMDAEAERLVQKLREQGRKPYLIPGGGSNPVGALGYVDCARELIEQTGNLNLDVDWVVHGTGSTGTQAGLLSGFEAAGSAIRVYGVCVSRPAEIQEQAVFELAGKTSRYLGSTSTVRRESIQANGDYVGPGYGQVTPGVIEAIQLSARLEGLLLDPVYSAKAMAGLIDLCRRGFFKPGENVVFLHTGGTPGLFAYESAFDF